jgi:quercetin dioxygenase-like cupin family protein
MPQSDDANVRAAEVVLPCAELHETLGFFTERLGFLVHSVVPADDPSAVVVTGHGLRVRLERGRGGSAGVLRLHCRDPRLLGQGETELTAPNGTRIELVAADATLDLPALRPSLVVSRVGAAAWALGRAGMRYRDLLPDRQGGRFLASHIRIPGGGPVPDYVHFHRVRFQMIYCVRGRVRVAYEQQGPPFQLLAGDCVLQPPGIRHRVLESADDLEVVEITSPAAHETVADHELALPTDGWDPEREFGGQRFVRHELRAAEWRPWRAGFLARDLGIAAASREVARATVVRCTTAGAQVELVHQDELRFRFVLQGAMTLDCDGHAPQTLVAHDACTVPAGMRHRLGGCSADLEWLEVAVGEARRFLRLSPRW